MRLICGVLRLDGGAGDAATLADMAAAMTPPGLSVELTTHTDGPLALAVLGFPPDKPVLARSEDGAVLAADLRLDRPGELAAALGLPPVTASETLALTAWQRWGETLPDRLDGDYALAAWNAQRRQLTLARDLFAVRPLCTAHLPGRLFAFASLPKGLHGSGLVPPRPDLPALVQRLFMIYNKSETTGYQDIAWLPGGHTLTVGMDGIARCLRAWQPAAADVGTWRGSPAEAASILNRLVCDAVKTRIPASGTIASHLSGGLDSSAVSVLAARHLRQSGRSLLAYAFLPPPGLSALSDADRALVDAVLAQEDNIDGRSVALGGSDPLAIADSDLPGLDFELANHVNTFTAAAAAGASQFLTGAGGDEGATLGSKLMHAALLRRGNWRALLEDLPARARLNQRPLWRIGFHLLLRPFLPPGLARLERRWHGQANFDPSPALTLLAPPWRSAVQQMMPLPLTMGRYRPEGRIANFDKSFLRSRNTLWAVMGARCGLAISHPLLDRRIVDFVLSLPLERLLRGGHSRQPFRDAMADILPDPVRLARGKGAALQDLLPVLCAAKTALQAQAAALRSQTDVLDMKAVENAFAVLPERPELVTRLHRVQAVAALRALSLARHLDRMQSGCAL